MCQIDLAILWQKYVEPVNSRLAYGKKNSADGGCACLTRLSTGFGGRRALTMRGDPADDREAMGSEEDTC